MPNAQLHLGDCLSVMRDMPADSVDAIVTDPPYGLSDGPAKYLGEGGRGGFMGKAWDHGVPGVPFWEAALKVAKPGAMLLAFGGTRTHHRLMCAIEDAGWEIRDVCMWLYGSGFPKSANVSKLIDKAAGAERELVERIRPDGQGAGQTCSGFIGGSQSPRLKRDDVAATDAARTWDGWGTALKPAWEPIIMARKPLSEANIAQNVLRWGTGAINVDGCRIEVTPEDAEYTVARAGYKEGVDHISTSTPDENGHVASAQVYGKYGARPHSKLEHVAQGRWPANLILSDDAAALLDEMSGTLTSGKPNGAKRNVGGSTFLEYANGAELTGYGDTGGASRFFARFAPDDDEPLRMYYCAKASKRDRDEGLEGMPLKKNDFHRESSGLNQDRPNREGRKPNTEGARNHHPTVKSTPLMRWLTRLVCRPGGTILDPFCGSGSTGKACMLEGFNFVGVELDAEYLAIAEKRIEHARQQVAQMSLELP